MTRVNGEGAARRYELGRGVAEVVRDGALTRIALAGDLDMTAVTHDDGLRAGRETVLGKSARRCREVGVFESRPERVRAP